RPTPWLAIETAAWRPERMATSANRFDRPNSWKRSLLSLRTMLYYPLAEPVVGSLELCAAPMLPRGCVAEGHRQRDAARRQQSQNVARSRDVTFRGGGGNTNDVVLVQKIVDSEP